MHIMMRSFIFLLTLFYTILSSVKVYSFSFQSKHRKKILHPLHFPSSTINSVLSSTTTDDVSIGMSIKDGIDNRIDNVLNEKRLKLLSDNNYSNCDENNIRSYILSSRLPGLYFLNKSEVRPSSILGAGRGLFAKEDICNGEVITCYPGDALLIKEKGKEGLLWGEHVPKADVWDDEAVFVGTESTPPLTSYSVSVDDQYSVLGLPTLDDNPAYYGHYANDGAGIDEYDTMDMKGGGPEESIAAYESKSEQMRNARHQAFPGYAHMVTRATRHIKQGEEILVT